MCLCLSECLPHVCAGLRRSQKTASAPIELIAGGCELPKVGIGKTHSDLQNPQVLLTGQHFFRPSFFFLIILSYDNLVFFKLGVTPEFRKHSGLRMSQFVFNLSITKTVSPTEKSNKCVHGCSSEFSLCLFLLFYLFLVKYKTK